MMPNSNEPNLPVPQFMEASISWVEGREPELQTSLPQPEDLGPITPPGPPPPDPQTAGNNTLVFAALGLGAAFIAYRLFVK